MMRYESTSLTEFVHHGVDDDSLDDSGDVLADITWSHGVATE
jgi:hypothetical protein